MGIKKSTILLSALCLCAAVCCNQQKGAAPCVQQKGAFTDKRDGESITPAQGLDSAVAIVGDVEQVQLDTSRTQRIKRVEAAIAEIIAQELLSAARTYEHSYHRSIPACVNCSDLEMLLILERANEKSVPMFESLFGVVKDVPQVDVPHITKDMLLKNELMEADAKYEEAFGKKRPWWWVCPDKEKLARIKQSLANSTPYPEYGGDRGEIDYLLGKATAGYEMWFKKLPPRQECSDEEWLALLDNAINAESPLLTEAEEAALRAEYFKKFKRPATEFETSIVKVSLVRRIEGYDHPQTTVIRTAVGGVAIYQPSAGYSDIVSVNSGSIEMGLNRGEWLDFTSALHKYVGDWGEADYKRSPGEYLPSDYKFWELKLFFANADAFLPRPIYSYDECPLDWGGLVKFMGAMEAKTKF